MDEEPDPAAPSRSRVLLLLSVVVAVGLTGVALAAAADRLDSALLFVGVPCLLALAVGLIPGSGGWGTLFQVVTVVLLLASALLHEGALCVLIAAPLVYGFAALVYASGRAFQRRARLALFPVLALVAMEGALPNMRVSPDQQAEAQRLVAPTCVAFERALARGPRVDPSQDRGRLLRVAQYPTPLAVAGTGLEVGDNWRLRMPDGVIRTRVERSEADRLAFTVLSDDARTTRWIDLRSGELTWGQEPEGCVATLTVDYRRKLDPAFWFGPVTEVFMNAGSAALLAGLD